jgi:intein-encoded DNA endonuclease-like protein
VKIFIHIDDHDLDDIAAAATAAIGAWVAGCDCVAQAVSEQDPQSGAWTLGLTIDTSRKAMLKKALDVLYGIAREYQRECVVGFIDAETGAAQKVCYFGHEEGRPDIDEIGSYLGLRR